MHEFLKATFVFKWICLLQRHSPNIKANSLSPPPKVSLYRSTLSYSLCVKAITWRLFENMLQVIFPTNFSGWPTSQLVEITLFVYSNLWRTNLTIYEYYSRRCYRYKESVTSWNMWSFSPYQKTKESFKNPICSNYLKE